MGEGWGGLRTHAVGYGNIKQQREAEVTAEHSTAALNVENVMSCSLRVTGILHSVLSTLKPLPCNIYFQHRVGVAMSNMSALHILAQELVAAADRRRRA